MDFFIIFLLFIIISALAFFVIKFWWDLRLLKKDLVAKNLEITDLSAENGTLSKSYSKLWKEYQILLPYSKLADADTYAEERINEADRYFDSKAATAQAITEKKQSEANQIILEAKQEGRLIKQRQLERESEANSILSTAQNQATVTINEAHAKAEVIAGRAYYALNNSESLEAAASAMEARIKGYGDRYLLDTESWVDALAEAWDHKQAGIELKTARLKTKQMIDQQLAASCDYAEPKRRETAVRFVIDAFNGSVDSILAKARSDNYGTLEKKINDAFQLVNHHGSAFRNTKITDQYLDARMKELYWTVGAKELEKRHREEQREIKEAMREEARAKKEYEKAIKEAEKEEGLLNEAREQARLELREAGQAERLALESQLAQIEEQLRIAEEKNQRAISMAQQTRIGNVYIISNIGSFGEDVFKIGMTRRLQPKDRVKELSDASVPFKFDIHAMIHSEDAPNLELELHRLFEAKRVNRVNHRKEFFNVSLSEIKQAIEAKGVGDVKWTMEAEAQEFRETKAIEKKLS